MDEMQRPPFLDIDGMLKRARECAEKRELPIVILRQFFEHRAHATLTIFEFQKFADKELRAMRINIARFAAQELGRGPAQIFKSEHWVGAQEFTRGLQRIRQ